MAINKCHQEFGIQEWGEVRYTILRLSIYRWLYWQVITVERIKAMEKGLLNFSLIRNQVQVEKLAKDPKEWSVNQENYKNMPQHPAEKEFPQEEEKSAMSFVKYSYKQERWQVTGLSCCVLAMWLSLACLLQSDLSSLVFIQMCFTQLFVW